jgi:hypothetical protein
MSLRTQATFNDMTALVWASFRGHAETVLVLVEIGASLEAVDKVNTHVNALAYTCSIKHVSGIRRMPMNHDESCVCIWICIYIHSYTDIYIHMYVCMYVYTKI